MPIPALTRAAGRSNVSQGTGDPVNGVNTFLHNWDIPVALLSTDHVKINYEVLGPSVTVVRPAFVGFSADGLSLQVTFGQTGADQVTITAEHVNSAVA